MAGGNVADSQIAEQIAVLNADYAKTGLSFKLTNTTRTVNKSWFQDFAQFMYVVILSLATLAHQYTIQASGV